MKSDLNGPADTTMMGVVHDALRRDLIRVRTALTASSPAPGQRIALADHVVWMMDFLHEHHHNEDSWLWPFVRERNPAAQPLLDSMEADHHVIEPRVADVRAAAHEYRNNTSPTSANRLADALDALKPPLFDHLDREEKEAMPVVSNAITNREWQRLENKHNVRGKSLSQLATEGHWLADSLDPPRYAVLIQLVPAPVRAIILKAYRRKYAAACTRRWGADVDCRPATAASGQSQKRSRIR